ncbi:hypothetical protein ACFXDE_34265 [Kitasatospora sp. NPDC059408]|uniref:hypothetical protein n=1 Tax=Kitasatospora sp. NPDC059408 TaxID=3346823 RepID=UPI0036A820F7
MSRVTTEGVERSTLRGLGPHFVIAPPGAEAAGLAAALAPVRAEAHSLLVLAAAEDAAPVLRASLPELTRAAYGLGADTLVLAASGLAAPGPDGRRPAELLAGRAGLTVVAPDAVVSVEPDGTLRAVAGSWWRCRPGGGQAEPLGERWPAAATLTPLAGGAFWATSGTPAGRPAILDHASGRDGAVVLVIGEPSGRLPSGAQLVHSAADVMTSARPDSVLLLSAPWAEPIELVELAAVVAASLRYEVRAAIGLPVRDGAGHHHVHVAPDGTAGWEPYLTELAACPVERKVTAVGWRSRPDAPTAPGPARYPAFPGWELEAVAAGLWLRPTGTTNRGPRMRRPDPARPVLVVGTPGRPVTEDTWARLGDALATLPSAPRLGLVVAGTMDAESQTVGRFCARLHGMDWLGPEPLWPAPEPGASVPAPEPLRGRGEAGVSAPVSVGTAAARPLAVGGAAPGSSAAGAPPVAIGLASVAAPVPEPDSTVSRDGGAVPGAPSVSGVPPVAPAEAPGPSAARVPVSDSTVSWDGGVLPGHPSVAGVAPVAAAEASGPSAARVPVSDSAVPRDGGAVPGSASVPGSSGVGAPEPGLPSVAAVPPVASASTVYANPAPDGPSAPAEDPSTFWSGDAARAPGAPGLLDGVGAGESTSPASTASVGPDAAARLSECDGGPVVSAAMVAGEVDGTDFSVPAPPPAPALAVTRGPDAAAWLSECDGGPVVSAAMVVAEVGGTDFSVPAPPPASALVVTRGPDAAAWLSECDGGPVMPLATVVAEVDGTDFSVPAPPPAPDRGAAGASPAPPVAEAPGSEELQEPVPAPTPVSAVGGLRDGASPSATSGAPAFPDAGAPVQAPAKPAGSGPGGPAAAPAGDAASVGMDESAPGGRPLAGPEGALPGAASGSDPSATVVPGVGGVSGGTDGSVSAPPVGGPESSWPGTAAGLDGDATAVGAEGPARGATLGELSSDLAGDRPSSIPGAAVPDTDGGAIAQRAGGAAATSAPSEPSSDRADAPPPQPAEAPTPTPTPAADRTALVALLGSAYPRLARRAEDASTRLPGLRPQAAGGDPGPELVAVLVHHAESAVPVAREDLVAAARTGAPGPLGSYLRCLTAGLRRLPSHYGGVLLAAPADGCDLARFTPGAVFTERAPVSGLAAVGADLGEDVEVEFAVWSVGGRRCSAFGEPGEPAAVVFAPGTGFEVVAVDAADPAAGVPARVLLHEVGSIRPAPDRLRTWLARRDAIAPADRVRPPHPAHYRLDLGAAGRR